MATHGDEQKPNERAGNDGLTPITKEGGAYDATRDPRTGRPPDPLEAQRLAREHEQKRRESDETAGDGDGRNETIGTSVEQAPARRTSPHETDDEKAAVDALIEEGIAREEALRLVETHGANWETLKAVAWTMRKPPGQAKKP